MFVGTLYGLSEEERQMLLTRIRRKMGAPVVGVEIMDEQIEECICEAIEEYSGYVNMWIIQNRFAEMLGVPNEVDLTLKFISNSMYFEKLFSQTIAEQAGFGMEGGREMKIDIIHLSAGVQHYEIPADRELSEIMWYTPAFINMFGLDPFSPANIAFTEFGASFAGYSLYHVMPVFDTVLTVQAAELRNRMRGSEFSYIVRPGPDGKKILTLFPPPRPVSSSYQLGGTATPGTLLYFYRDKSNRYGNPDYVPGNNPFLDSLQSNDKNLVSNPATAKLTVISYAQLNNIGQNWVRKYAQASAKELLATFIRGKFEGRIPIPDGELTLNVSDISSSAREEKERLREELKNYLSGWNYDAIIEQRAKIQENLSTIYSNTAFPIYLY